MHYRVVIVFVAVFQLVWVFHAIVITILVFMPVVPCGLRGEIGRRQEAGRALGAFVSAVEGAT